MVQKERDGAILHFRARMIPGLVDVLLAGGCALVSGRSRAAWPESERFLLWRAAP